MPTTTSDHLPNFGGITMSSPRGRVFAARLEDFEQINPDEIYNPGAITFVYDVKKKHLYQAQYPETHEELMNANDHEIARSVGWEPNDDHDDSLPHYFTDRDYLQRDDAYDYGLILGRVGKYEDTVCIGIWNPDIKERILKNCLRSLTEEIPDLRKNPNKVVVYFDRDQPAEDPEYLTTWLPDVKPLREPEPSKKEPEPVKAPDNCGEVGSVNVDGRPMTLPEIISSLHMVRGPKLDAIKSAFCANAAQIKAALEKSGCESDVNLANWIWSRAGCKVDANTYNTGKEAGKAAYRNDLQKLFSKPEKLDTEFRGRQKDIDAAWDYLQKKEHSFHGFKAWLLEGTT